MLGFVVVTAALAAAGALPVSASAHAVALRVAAPSTASVLGVATAAAALGAALAPLLVCAPRLGRLARGARGAAGLARSELVAVVAAAAVGGAGHAAIEPVARAMASTTLGAGLGLLTTSVAVGSIAIAPSPTRRTVSPAIAAIAALAVALGALPGGSSIGLAIAALAWCGVAEPDAVETGALVAAPAAAVAAVRALGDPDLGSGLAAGDVAVPSALAAAVAVLAASLALAGLRRWARHRTVATAAVWTGTVGLALLAHAYVAAS